MKKYKIRALIKDDRERKMKNLYEQIFKDLARSLIDIIDLELEEIKD